MKDATRREIIEWLLIASALAVSFLIASMCAPVHAEETPPAPPTNLTARAGPGRTITWECGWDRAAGYGPDSITFNVWRQDTSGTMWEWRHAQTPAQMGCYIVYGRYSCLDKSTWQPIICGPEEHYRCRFDLYRDGGEPVKDFFMGVYTCDPGGCAPPPPRQPVWEPILSCIDNGGQGCESDYHPVSP